MTLTLIFKFVFIPVLILFEFNKVFHVRGRDWSDVLVCHIHGMALCGDTVKTCLSVSNWLTSVIKYNYHNYKN